VLFASPLSLVHTHHFFNSEDASVADNAITTFAGRLYLLASLTSLNLAGNQLRAMPVVRNHAFFQ
jgi:hypothetical protein